MLRFFPRVLRTGEFTVKAAAALVLLPVPNWHHRSAGVISFSHW